MSELVTNIFAALEHLNEALELLEGGVDLPPRETILLRLITFDTGLLAHALEPSESGGRECPA